MDCGDENNGGLTIFSEVSDLKDVDEIEGSDVSNHGVVIGMPQFLSPEDCGRPTLVIKQLRVIAPDVLQNVIGIDMEVCNEKDIDKNFHVIKRLSGICNMESASANNDVSATGWQKFNTFVDRIIEFSQTMQLDTSYVDPEGLSHIGFDRMSHYTNDPETSDLVAVKDEPIKICNRWYHLYSELGGDLEACKKIRKRMNDCDTNRCRYYMQEVVKMLTIETDHLADNSVQLLRIVFLLLAVLTNSRPIRDRCANDLRANYTGYMTDLFFRSRLMQAWIERQPHIMRNIILNHNKNALMVKMANIATPRGRFTFLADILVKNHPKLKKYIDSFNYDSYTAVLDDLKVSFDGGKSVWYQFNIDFLTKTYMMQGLTDLAVNINDDLFNNEC